MIVHPALAALIAVMTIGNLFVSIQRFRRRFARFFGPPKTIQIINPEADFTQINAFADALHMLCHDYNVEITGIVFDENAHSYSAVSFGSVRCEAVDLTRVRDYKVASLMLAKDADELFEWIEKQSETPK